METNIIYLGDCIEVLKGLPDVSVDLVATDPPFNIGLKYDLYDDKKDYKAYIQWCRDWLTECHRVLKTTGSIFVCIGDEYQAEINILLKELGFYWRNTIVWYYTFGENQKKKFNRTHTIIHYFSKSGTEYRFFPESVKVPSKRQLMGDKRAKKGGKIPDDIWESTQHQNASPSALQDGSTESYEAYEAEYERRMDLLDQMPGGAQGAHPDMSDFEAPNEVPGVLLRLGEAVGIPDDVWKISRVCGSFKERILDADGTAHPCQMPLSVMTRIIKCSTEPGDIVFDPFCGTGTTAVAAKALDRRFITVDISEKYAGVAAQRISW